jgi:hypothetical protein
MDLPQLREDAPAHRPYAAVRAAPWYGEAGIWWSPDEAGFTLLDVAEAPAQTGTLAADLPAGPLWRFDEGSELLVDLRDGTLASIGDAALLAGGNALAVEAAPGAWEIVQAGTAELVSAGRYRLAHLLRGQRGTEQAMGDPAPAGAAVVVLTDALRALPVALDQIGAARTVRAGPAGEGAVGDHVTATTFTPEGRGLRPFEPVHPRARRLASGDIEIRWTRRSRAPSADSWTLTEAPMIEDAETYDLEIRDGTGAVVRTVEGLAAPAFTWTAAMQTADLGAAAPDVRLCVWQLGALGRGAALEATVRITEAT